MLRNITLVLITVTAFACLAAGARYAQAASIGDKRAETFTYICKDGG